MTTALVTLMGVAPALAKDFLSGQPYFGITMMLTAAANADISSAPRALEPAFHINNPQLGTDTGYGVIGTLGWLFDNNWRVEAEIGHRQLGLNRIVSYFDTTSLDGTLDVTTTLVNVVKDFRGKSFITPYFGLGVGVGFHKIKLGSIAGVRPSFGTQQDGFSIVYQALLGVNFEVGEDLDLVVGYRFLGDLDPDFGAFALKRLDIHSFDIGIKFYFEDWGG